MEKSVGKKYYLIMAFKRQIMNYSTMLGIIFIPCCAVVLMQYNEYYKNSAYRKASTLNKQKTL